MTMHEFPMLWLKRAGVILAWALGLWVAAIAALVLLGFLLLTAGGARAAEPDGGSMYGRAEFSINKTTRQKPARIKRVSRVGQPPINNTATILPHPSCCPPRSFCACGAAFKIFGECRRDLWPSTAWLKFPRTSPGHMKVAVRPGHVFVIDYMLDERTAMAWDFNSGGHQSRYHARSIAGYAVVDPHGARLASLSIGSTP